MPTYDYECEKCGHKFELFQQMTALPIKECPQCEGKVRRLIGAGAGIIFKGKGFYQTDYKNAKDKKNKETCPLNKDKPTCEGCSAKTE